MPRPRCMFRRALELGVDAHGVVDAGRCDPFPRRVRRFRAKGDEVMLDYRIETFLAVCRTLNYTRAAEELSLTQPAVSQHIAALERAYGVKLFLYRNKKLVLTPAGEALRVCAEGMRHEAELLRRDIEAIRVGRESLTIGATLTAGEYLLAAPLGAWLAQHRSVDAHVVSGDTAHLLSRIDDGTLDFALIEGFFDKNAYDWSVLCEQRLVGVCAPDHHLAQGPAVGWGDLLAEHLVVREVGSGTRALFEHAMEQRNLSVEGFARITEVDSLNVIKRLVESGLGIAFLYEAAVADDLLSGRLVRIPFADEGIAHDITFVCQKGGVLRARFRAMFKELAELYGG